MKKVLVVALSALLLLAMFIPAMANENPKVITAVSATEVKPGETITVTVSLDKTINTRGMAIDFKDACNSGTFEVVNAAFNSEFAGKCMMAPVNTAKLNATSAAQAAFDWTGEVFTLTLKVAENAAFGDYEIKVVVKDVKDANKQNIEVELVGATVKVTHDCVLADTYNTTDPDFHWKDCTVPGCNVAPVKEAHSYDNACDTTCNVCNRERAITHDFSVQESDAVNHWMKCSVCGTIDEASKVAHTAKAEDILVSEANCKDKAVYKKECSVCNAQIGETFEVGETDPSKHIGGTANCANKKVCTYCSQPYGEIDPAVHTGNTKVTKAAEPSTCTVPGWTEEISCADCNAVLTPSTPLELKAHDFTKLEKDENNHWYVCSVCAAVDETSKVAHTGGAANCVTKAACEVCGQAYGDVDATTHTGNTKVTKAAQDSTCAGLGWTEEISCADCNAVLTPSVGLEDVIPHMISTWTVVEEATETKTGLKKGTCLSCGAEFTVPTEKVVTKVENEDAKVEAVGDTKLPESTDIVVSAPEGDAYVEEAGNAAEALKDNADFAGKEVMGLAYYYFNMNYEIVDPATGALVSDLSVFEKLPGLVKISVPVEADAAKYDYVVFVVDIDGKATKVNATIVGEELVFETDIIGGAVVLAGSEKKAVETTTTAPATTADPNVPQNGDASNVVFFTVLAFVSVLTLGAVVITKRAKASK